jgi:hypothetical protein
MKNFLTCGPRLCYMWTPVYDCGLFLAHDTSQAEFSHHPQYHVSNLIKRFAHFPLAKNFPQG